MRAGTYGALSNFYDAPFTGPDGARYRWSEQYFMKVGLGRGLPRAGGQGRHGESTTRAQGKQELFDPANARLAAAIMAAKNPRAVKALGRKVKNFDEGAWAAARCGVMREALRMKFGGNPAAAAVLLGVSVNAFVSF